MARKIIGSVWDREARNAINDNFEELYGYKNTADSAKEAADYAVNTAEYAKAKADSVQEQFNQVVIEGDSSVEAAQARVDAEGKTYPTLKARLDAKETEFSSQLAQATDNLNQLKVRNLPIALDDYARTKLADMCNEYVAHYDEFIYGGYHDAFRHFQPINGKYEISCSVFSMLILLGIPYKNSKYGGGNNTPNGEGWYNQELYDFYSDVSGGSQKTYKYSEHLAEWLYERGFCFFPEDDLSNVDTGDVLFYNNELNEDEDERFLGIDHTAVFAYHQNDNTYGVWEVRNAGPVFAKYITSDYKPVMVARLPRKNGSMYLKNIGQNTERIYTTTTNFIRGVVSPEGYKANRQYTLVAKINYKDKTSRVYPGISDERGVPLMSDYGAITPPDDGIYVLPFVPKTDVSAVRLETRTSEPGLNVEATCEWVTVYEGLILNDKKSRPSINTVSLTPLSGFTITATYVNQNGFTVISGVITGDISTSMTNVATITTTKKTNVVVGSLINDNLESGQVIADFRASTYYLRAKNTGTNNYFSIVIPN